MNVTRLLIWRTPTGEDVAPTYRHMALETEMQGRLTYMSFHLSGRCCQTEGAHFHFSRSEDDSHFRERVVTYTFNTLDVEKIVEAFEQFRSAPEARGSLGGTLLTRSYVRNAAGLTAYLLDRGGIFQITSFQEKDWNLTLLKHIAGWGLFFTLVTGFTAHHLVSFSRTDSPQFKELSTTYHEAVEVARRAESAAATIDAQARQIRQDTGRVEATEIGVLARVSGSFLHRNTHSTVYPFLRTQQEARYVGEQYGKIAMIACGVSLCSIGTLLVYNHFLAPKYERMDEVERLVRSVPRAKRIREVKPGVTLSKFFLFPTSIGLWAFSQTRKSAK